jgi:class 3 adenylate cyclase
MHRPICRHPDEGAEVSVRKVGTEAMKRKIAAIMAADVAGYSKLVAEDEEETVRRLAVYRAVIDDFIAKAGGRVFNTAGDAVLAEFPSAVEAVRCAIDIQESLRTRNLAYPPSRQMNFRIGITIGDVIERDGDLLGDGVNIAARLEGLAQVGGICISRAVHEQVVNKLSVQFADIGEQQVKNIPTPVYAYMLQLRAEDGLKAAAVPNKASPSAPPSRWPAAIALAGVVAIAAAAAYVPLVSYLRGASTAQREAPAAPAPNRRASRPPERQALGTPTSPSTPAPSPPAIKPATLAATLAMLTLRRCSPSRRPRATTS